MDIRKLQRTIVDGLEDVKAQNIAVFNTEHLSALFERVIIASGTSNRQTKALAASVRDAVRAKGFSVMRTEGEENGEWIIVDCGAAVVHVMQQPIRDYYHLEEIWGDKPVRMKLDGGTARVGSDAPPRPARKPPASAQALRPDRGDLSVGSQAGSGAAADEGRAGPGSKPAGRKSAGAARGSAGAATSRGGRKAAAGATGAEPKSAGGTAAKRTRAAAADGRPSDAGPGTGRSGRNVRAASAAPAEAPARRAAKSAATPTGVTRTVGVKRAAAAGSSSASRRTSGAKPVEQQADRPRPAAGAKVAGKTAAGKTAAGKTAGGKTAAGKTAAGKTAARKAAPKASGGR